MHQLHKKRKKIKWLMHLTNFACTKNSSRNLAARSPSSSVTDRFGRRPPVRESVKSEKKRKSAERRTNVASASKRKHLHEQKKNAGSKLSASGNERVRRRQGRRQQQNVVQRRSVRAGLAGLGRPCALLSVTGYFASPSTRLQSLRR